MAAYALVIFIKIAFNFNLAEGHIHHHYPRVIMTGEDCLLKKYELVGSPGRVELLPGPEDRTVYASGDGQLFYVDFRESGGLKEIPVLQNNCSKACPSHASSCEYTITVLHGHKNGTALFICGTNGISPACCSASRETGLCHKCYPAEGMAPFSVHERAPSLFVGEELYTTANLFAVGNGVGIRRHFGDRGKVWPGQNVTEQNYVGLVVSPRLSEIQDRIFAFLAERNMDQHPEADPWVSLVTQVCQADRGGPKLLLQRRWTSHLSARLMCGIAEKKLFFNRLLDVTVLEQNHWAGSRVYALFSNGWGMTAICVFTMGDIDHVFTDSHFKGFSGAVPNPRPGSCVKDSTQLSHNVLTLVKDHPEMEDWVWPENKSDPLLVSRYPYKYIRVDTVQTSRGDTYRVLLLILESGRVHKVLEQAGHAFIMAELQPFTPQSHIRNVLLQPHTNKLYLSSSSEVVELDLQDCRAYGPGCEDCVLARDPYCGWNGTECTLASSSVIQDVEHGNYLLCLAREEGDASRRSTSPRHETHKVPANARHFLSCPMRSTHATYSWHHNGSTTDCLVTDGQCLLLIEAMSPYEAGTYLCRASERGYTRLLLRHEVSIDSQAPALCPVSPLLFIFLLFLCISHTFSLCPEATAVRGSHA